MINNKEDCDTKLKAILIVDYRGSLIVFIIFRIKQFVMFTPYLDCGDCACASDVTDET